VNTGALDLVQALRFAAGANAHPGGDYADEPRERGARGSLHRAERLLCEQLELPSARRPAAVARELARWEQAPARTHSEVLELIDRAVARVHTPSYG
jgi:hypothetical protein